MKKEINIGTLLQDYIQQNKISKAALSRALQTDPANLEVRLKKAYMRTDFLEKICIVLKHNFFADIAEMFPADFSVNAQPETTKDELIAQLELEIKMITRERDLLAGVISGKLKE